MPAVGAATFWMSGPAPLASVEPLRTRRVPLLLAALAFAAGILMARQWHTAPILLLSVAMLAGLSWAAIPRSPWVGWLAVLSLWAGVGCWSAQVQRPVARQLAMAPYADGLSRMVRGRVVATRPVAAAEVNRSAPGRGVASWQVEPGGWETEADEPSRSIDLAVDAMEEVTPDTSTMMPLQGGVRLTVLGKEALGCGDQVEVPVRLRRPEVYRDPGAFSYADWLLGQGVSLTGTARASKVHLLQQGRGTVACRLQAAQQWAAGRLARLPDQPLLARLPRPLQFTRDDAAMLAAMLFGDKTALGADLRAGFERTGTFHLFVVSGLHIALFTGALFWLLRRARLPEWPAVILTLALALGYTCLTGFGVPAQRALGMSALYLVARAVDRQRSALNALGAACLVILTLSPRALFEPSFQMTALVILAVAGLGSPLSERLFDGWRTAVQRLEVAELDAFLAPWTAERRVCLRLWGRLCRDLTGIRHAEAAPAMAVRAALLLGEAVLFSAVIELCMSLPMALYFHRAVPLAMPTNLLIAPVAMLLAIAGIVTFAALLLGSWLAIIPAAFTALLLHAVQAVVRHLGSTPLSQLRVPTPPVTGVLLFCALLAFSCWALRERQRLLMWCGASAALLLLAVTLWPAAPTVHPGTLEVTALDVGQGDSLLVVSPEGRTLLVDAGGPVGRITTRWDVGEEVVAPYLWSRHMRRLDALLITHAHSDHIGGVPAVLKDLRPRELWLSIEPGESPALRAVLDEAQALNIPVHRLLAGDEFAWGGVHAAVLAPEPGYLNPGEARNNDSLVMRLDWERASVLLAGDAEAPSEAAMLANARLRPVSLLKVGHHGSLSSTTPDFLTALAPRDAVISVGQQNTFGHPRLEVLERLETAHVQTFRTDRDGAETFLLYPDGRVQPVPAYN